MRGFFMFLLLLPTNAAVLAAELDAASIMQQVAKVKRVDDQIATLTFRFIVPGKPEQKAQYTMVWMDTHGKEGYANKTLFFTTEPIEKRGIAYLGWLRPPGSDKLDDEWIYLPELRMTRRIAHRDHAHNHDDDEFGLSLLQRDHLEPRPVEIDSHTLLESNALCHNKTCYVIASTPEQAHNHHHQPQRIGKLLHWIDKEKFITVRQQFFNSHDELTVDMSIEWQEQQGYWLWRRIIADDAKKERRTTLEITDIKVNVGLKERDFSKKSLEKGLRF